MCEFVPPVPIDNSASGLSVEAHAALSALRIIVSSTAFHLSVAVTDVAYGTAALLRIVLPPGVTTIVCDPQGPTRLKLNGEPPRLRSTRASNPEATTAELTEKKKESECILQSMVVRVQPVE
ncbi:hypothetical protein Tcan_03544 [Toxocara canis]|uniref:Uncharacterized protein n=1 Tax=Toxocara canis TaxID=6265 RepID=A0A0B2UYM8_TOXCA|nr:hypothetical protein Tcan_03544 [Toxocara canis]